MEHRHDRRFALFKGRMDFFIGGHVKVHGMDHKLNAPGLATMLALIITIIWFTTI